VSLNFDQYARNPVASCWRAISSCAMRSRAYQLAFDSAPYYLALDELVDELRDSA
jgi:hypothetical protein